MATRTWEGTVNAKWNEKLNWSGATEPTAADDVILNAASPACTIDATGAACRSLDASLYKNTLKINSSVTLKIGTSTSNGGLCLKLGSGMTLTIGSAATTLIELVAAQFATVEEITTAGKKMPNVTFAGTKGSYKLMDKFEQESASNVMLLTSAGEAVVDFNSQEVVLGALEILGTGGSATEVKARSSVIKLTRTAAGTVLKDETICKWETSTIEITGTGTNVKKINVNEESQLNLLVLKVDAVEIVGSLSCKKLELLTAGLTTGTKVTQLKEVKIAESISTNAKSGSTVKLLSTVVGKKWKLKLTTGTVNLDWLVLEDCEAADSTHYYAGANSTLTNDVNWKAESAPAEGNPMTMLL